MVFEYPAPTREGLDAVARAYDDVGNAPAVIAADGPPPDTAFADAYNLVLRHAMADKGLLPGKAATAGVNILDRLKTQLHHWRWGRDRIRLALGPTIPLLCLTRSLRDAATWHALMAVAFTPICVKARSRLSSVCSDMVTQSPEHLDSLGLLTSDLTCAHAVWLSETDRKAASRMLVQPLFTIREVIFRLGSGTAQVRAMLDAGIVVGLGTDGATCADSLNMFEAMRLMTHASRSFANPITAG